MTTAYEESLNQADEQGNFTPPKYIMAADTMNMANGNGTLLDSVAEGIDSVGKFTAVSLISGANQIYNIPTDVGNLFGAEDERSETEDVVAALDDDLSPFYAEHKESADLVGFMATSLIPGTLGVKVAKAGQTSLRGAINAGKFGEGMGKALGLLAPEKSKWIAAATKEAINGSSAASLVSNKALRGVLAGVGQNAIEALAFETAVTATMFKSPMLENQDLGDFVTNVAWGAGIFGLAGGLMDAAKIGSSLKSARNAAEIEARPWTFIPEAHSASGTYEKLALDIDSLHAMPEVPSNFDADRIVKLNGYAAKKKSTLEGRIRSNLGELSGGDQTVADTLFQAFRGADRETQLSAFIGAGDATRLNVLSPLNQKLGGGFLAKIKGGKTSLAEAEEALDATVHTAYVKMWGERAGKLATERPVVTSLVDTLKAGEKIELLKRNKGVKAGGKVYAFDRAKAVHSGKVSVTEASARYIWASKIPEIVPTAKKPFSVDVNDIPLMERVLSDVKPADMQHVVFNGLEKGQVISEDLGQFLAKKKIEIANKLLIQSAGKKVPITQDEIAAIVNVKSSALSGELTAAGSKEFAMSDMLATQDHAAKYTQKLIDQGARRESDGLVDLWNLPQHIKLTYDSTPFKGVNNFVLENMQVIKSQQKLYQQDGAMASAGVLGDDYARFEDITSGRVYSGAQPSGAGAGYLSSADGNYGSMAGSVANIGRTTSEVIEKFKARTNEALAPLLYKLGNNQEAAIEWSVLNARVRNIEGEYGLNAAGDALEPLSVLRYKAEMQAVEGLENAPRIKEPNLSGIRQEDLVISIKNQATKDLLKAHIELNGKRTNSLAQLRTAQGYQFNRAPDAFYPIPVNPSDYPFFAMVVDNSITSGNHSKTLYANSAKELEEMSAKITQDNPHLNVLTKGDAEQHYKNIGQFDYEKTLSNNYLDTAAKRSGVSAPYLPATDPTKITKDMLEWHMQRESSLVREAVTSKYEVQFEELKRLGDKHDNMLTSKFGSNNLSKFSGDAKGNPYRDYIKTALSIKKTAEYPWHSNFNKMVDEKFSQMYNKIVGIRDSAKSPEDLKAINVAMEKAGYKGAAYDESMAIFANAQAPKGVLNSVIQKANGLMATVVLRWDALNAVNNAVSANVLLGAEAAAVTRAISRGDSEAAGALAGLTRIKVPGVDKTIFSPSKLIANSVKKFNRTGEDFQFYKDNGFMTSISSQYAESVDDLVYKGASKESVQTWDGRVNKRWAKMKAAGDLGEKATGNKLAEEFNRFVAADVMKQMTDVAVERGLMGAKEQLTYINTFVNRTQGNYLASQRPMMFHGAVGQAVGLFQTYQFNLMQQMLRHVGEGHGKDAATLLGLQGTIHGMSGLPAFNAINSTLIGNASGNDSHKDAYDAVYGAAGKEGGDWLMHGLASNMLLVPELKTNLYTRGDINPRQVTIIPTDPSNVPIVQATAKAFNNLFKTVGKLQNGGDISNTLLQGLEHNGLSRPLAGIAQTLQGLNNPEQASYSTSSRGNVIASNDLFSLSNLVRIAGGKPMDEAIAIDATYRYKAYALKDSAKRTALGQALKTKMQAGETPSTEDVHGFVQKYVEGGGQQKDFNSWFGGLYKSANLSQANKIQESLTDPYAQSMQLLMGGKPLKDFSQP